MVYLILNIFEPYYSFSLFFQAFEDLSKLMVKVKNAFLSYVHIVLKLLIYNRSIDLFEVFSYFIY